MRITSGLLRFARWILLPLALLSERLGNRFYLGLAVVVIVGALYGIAGGLTGGMKHQAYDLIMKSRFRTPLPDPDIVLVDIDEASLAAMAPEYGRWPWPRSVIAELTESIARQDPAAIVYDITFSDLDVDHPDADRYFRDVAAHQSRTYFSMIRLNPANDSLSELKLARLPGVAPLGSEAPPESTVAMVVPYFLDVLNDRRLGTNNLYADDDGIARAYHVYRDAHGWRIYSLPANVAAALGQAPPERADVLLNWRGRPLSYRAVPFSAVYQSLQREHSDRPADEFKGKIVVIGSTAPSLFDIKPTPVSRDHPGVEIMMTAIDNLKNGDYLTELPSVFYMLITIVAIVLLAIAFVYNVDQVWLNTLFTTMQTGFLALTYLFVNFTTWFVDLTAPFTAALAYFFIVRIYNRVLTMRRNGHPLFSTALDTGRDCDVLLLACRYRGPDVHAQQRANRILQQQVGRTRFGASAPRLFASAPLLSGIYQDTVLFYWIVPPARTCAALGDLTAMLERSLAALDRHKLQACAQLALHAARLTIDPEGRWRTDGKAAFLSAISLLQRPSERALAPTDAFVGFFRGCSEVQIPATLARAGLDFSEAETAG
ncbi:MAG: CHASE2 domain-containing protein [Sulfurifustis sp.]